ncbi:phage tail tube protein [Rhizobium lusitanum]|uniref:Uncharacterized protein n=1 Tax=Rhizobium lusitanum TaxID=293958 RepID=A0A1C3USN1_9HYPH|nr:phage tail tube protein [Rhizobium lusitanum]SCB18510.1 hypothetical protein GA0061101_103272 [Rhizobium lusitanum]
MGTSKSAKKKAILFGTEVTEGLAAALTGALNAMQVTNFRPEPFLGQDVDRGLLLPYFGHFGTIFTANYGRVSFEVEIAGAGAAGTAPAYGPLLRACAMAETIAAATDVKYNPISDAMESATIFYFMDSIKHALVGARGTFTLSFQPAQIARFVFTFQGLILTATDTPNPTVDLTKFIKPVPVSKANTTFSLHGYAGACEAFSFDLGGDVQPRLLINDESIKFVDRRMVGNATMDAVALATVNWDQIAKSHTDGVMAAVHGKTAGNIVQFDAPTVQIGRYAYDESQNIITNTLPMMVKPTLGNDEFVITVK